MQMIWMLWHHYTVCSGITKNYSKASGSFWNFCWDELTGEELDVNGPNKNVINSNYLKYKTSITGSPCDVNNDDPIYEANKIGIAEVEIAVPLNIPLVNCEVFLSLTWFENCVTTSMGKRVLVEGQPDRDDSLTNAIFAIIECTLYVPVVTLSVENGYKPLQKLREVFKKRIKWSKNRSEMSNQARNNNLYYLIDPTFCKVNRLLVLSFENEENRTSFSKYYVPSVKIKYFECAN